MSRLVNIGCGSSWHPEWVNLDISPAHPSIKKIDAAGGLPFDDRSVDACYSSHVLEHLAKHEALNFLAECHRVLKHGGSLRIVVPDMEMIAREYLNALGDALNGNEDRIADYDWMVLELLDQILRETPGGEMAKYLGSPKLKNVKFIRSRVGIEVDSLLSGNMAALNWRQKLRIKGLKFLLDRARERIAELFVFIIAGQSTVRAFRYGMFRHKGEVHRWMYDRYSMTRLLNQLGFSDIKICEAGESRIPGFHRYGLDIVDGVTRKPDSLFVEATKL